MRKLIALLCLLALIHPARAAVIASGSSTFGSSATVSSFSLNRPASVNIDDLLFVQITLSGTAVTVSTAPVGWTLLSNDTNNSIRQYMYYRTATVLDIGGAATSWTLSGATNVAAAMVGFRSDLGGRTAIYGSISTSTGNNSTLTAAAMTATAPGRLLRFYGHASTNTLGVSGTTLTANAVVAATSSATLLAASRTLNASGTTGADSITASSSARYIAHSVLLTESQPNKPSTCFSDDFSSTSNFAQNWVTTSVGTTAFTPAIVGGRLQLTSNNGYISTAATLQRLFPTSNLIYVEFNYYSYPNSSGADGVAVTLSDSSVTPQPGGFGGSLGYAQRSDSGGINGFAGGWVGIALDEYGNYSNPTEGRNGGPGFRADSVAVRGSGSGLVGYPYLAGTAAGLSPGVDSNVTPGPGHRYRIVVDAAAPGQTYVTVDRDTTGAGTAYANLIPTFNIQSSAGQATIPANLMLSLTGSTGGSSNVHEIGNLSVCATTIQSVNQVDHFEIVHDGQGLTCEPENVTIRACANAACSTLMPGMTTVTLNPATGWTGGNVQLINGSAVLQLRQTTAGTAAISIANSSPGAKPFSVNKCNGANNNTCNLPFANAGLEFNVPNVLANKPSGAVRLRAVRNSGDASNSCVALFQNTTQAISFFSTYTTPNSGTRAVELRPGSGAGAFTSISGASPGTPLALTFDANGETTFEARYQDAGLMALNALYTGSGVYAGLSLTGSDSFVSTPAGFCIGIPNPSSPGNYITCASPLQNCNVLTTAGSPFSLNITAAAWQSDTDTDMCVGNGNTPNYAQNLLALTSQFGLTATEFGIPAGGVNGAVAPTTVNIVAGSGGAVALTNATESEVGDFRFIVTPPTNAYVGSTTVPPGTSVITGRFIPHHFAIPSGSSLVNRATSCAVPPIIPFTYMDERFDLDFSISAQNLSNQVTQNYEGNLAKLTTFNQLSIKAISPITPATSLLRIAFDSTAVPTRLALYNSSTPISIPWAKGAASFSSPATLPLKLTRMSTPSGPYTNFGIGIAPSDTDNVTTTGFTLDTTVPADSISDRVQIGGATELRHGRLRLDSVAGTVDYSLPLPITAEYWNGSVFVTNSADTSCSTISSALGSLGPYLGNLSNGETALSGSGVITSGQTSALQLSAPGTGNEGSVDVTLNLSAFPWLQFDWSGDGTLDSSVSATASFGLYRGSDRVIYWQETQ